MWSHTEKPVIAFFCSLENLEGTSREGEQGRERDGGRMKEEKVPVLCGSPLRTVVSWQLTPTNETECQIHSATPFVSLSLSTPLTPANQVLNIQNLCPLAASDCRSVRREKRQSGKKYFSIYFFLCLATFCQTHSPKHTGLSRIIFWGNSAP